jgi:hypothetical protein
MKESQLTNILSGVHSLHTEALTVGSDYVLGGTTERTLGEKVAGVEQSLGQRLTALMISKRLADSSVPMSLLADHPNVQFNYYRGGLGTCAVEMH